MYVDLSSSYRLDLSLVRASILRKKSLGCILYGYGKRPWAAEML